MGLKSQHANPQHHRQPILLIATSKALDPNRTDAMLQNDLQDSAPRKSGATSTSWINRLQRITGCLERPVARQAEEPTAPFL